MQRLEVSDAVRPIYGSLGVKRLIYLESTAGHKAPHFAFFPSLQFISPSKYAHQNPDGVHCSLSERSNFTSIQNIQNYGPVCFRYQTGKTKEQQQTLSEF